jgi:methyl coenzyme M reductase gamma subunit
MEGKCYPGVFEIRRFYPDPHIVKRIRFTRFAASITTKPVGSSIESIVSVHPEMVGCGSDQGRSEVETRRRSLESQASVAALRRGFRPSENAELGHKTPFMDGHLLRS